MEIIPVIDLMGGTVVQARGGERAHYQPVVSLLTTGVDLLTVVADLAAFFPFKTIYIADLDAIAGQPIDTALYQHCLHCFPEIQFWLDAGIADQTDLDVLDGLPQVVPVLGSESLKDLALMTQGLAVLSLDFKQGKLLGANDLFEHVAMWPDQVIVMNLDAVGALRGPELGLLETIRRYRPAAKIIAAGGVRDEEDLVSLKQAGVNKVLVASALHNGVITPEVVAKYQ